MSGFSLCVRWFEWDQARPTSVSLTCHSRALLGLAIRKVDAFVCVDFGFGGEPDDGVGTLFRGAHPPFPELRREAYDRGTTTASEGCSDDPRMDCVCLNVWSGSVIDSACVEDIGELRVPVDIHHLVTTILPSEVVEEDSVFRIGMGHRRHVDDAGGTLVAERSLQK